MRLFLLMSLLLGAFFMSPAQAQMACDDRADVLRHLSGKYHEAPVGLGIANNGGLVELLTTDRGSTWTLIITLPAGMTCLLAAGESWEMIPKPVFGEKMALRISLEKSCPRNPQYLRDFMEKNNPGAALVRELEGRTAADFVAAYNSFPPVSEIPGDMVILYISPGGASVYFVIFSEGCAKAQDQIPLLQFISIFPNVELYL